MVGWPWGSRIALLQIRYPEPRIPVAAMKVCWLGSRSLKIFSCHPDVVTVNGKGGKTPKIQIIRYRYLSNEETWMFRVYRGLYHPVMWGLFHKL